MSQRISGGPEKQTTSVPTVEERCAICLRLATGVKEEGTVKEFRCGVDKHSIEDPYTTVRCDDHFQLNTDLLGVLQNLQSH